MLDRELQKILLQGLFQSYPAMWKGIVESFPESQREAAVFNLYYLQEHGLVKLESSREIGKRIPPIVWATITATGIDFIQDDGGLTAILSVVTVKLHSETLAELATAIQVSNLPTDEKSSLLDKLRCLSEQGANTLIQEMVKAGLSKGPGAWEAALRFLNNTTFGG